MKSMTRDAVTRMSVRELIADLSEAEDELRRVRCAGADDPVRGTESEMDALVHREQLIVRELRRRARVRRIGEAHTRAGRR